MGETNIVSKKRKQSESSVIMESETKRLKAFTLNVVKENMILKKSLKALKWLDEFIKNLEGECSEQGGGDDFFEESIKARKRIIEPILNKIIEEDIVYKDKDMKDEITQEVTEDFKFDIELPDPNGNSVHQFYRKMGGKFEDEYGDDEYEGEDM